MASAPVVVPPCKALCDKLLGGEALHQLDDLEVGDSGDLGMLLEIEVLLCKEDALCTARAHQISTLHIQAGRSQRSAPGISCRNDIARGATNVSKGHWGAGRRQPDIGRADARKSAATAGLIVRQSFAMHGRRNGVV